MKKEVFVLNNFQNSIFETVDVLVENKLKNLSFDKTITAIIIDNSEAELGIYKVQEGASTYTAYSIGKEEIYENKDSVIITVPNGDYGNKLIIQGKNKNDQYVGELSISNVEDVFIPHGGNPILSELDISVKNENTT